MNSLDNIQKHVKNTTLHLHTHARKCEVNKLKELHKTLSEYQWPVFPQKLARHLQSPVFIVFVFVFVFH